MHGDIVLSLMLGFLIKHFIYDFLLQRKFQYENKGTFGHSGGILHAGLHSVGTIIVLSLVPGPTTGGQLILSGLDFIAHYLIDYTKVNLNARWGLKPDTSEWFWILLGFDQLLHGLTYILIIWLLMMELV
jgi:hypothetical protein